MKKGQQVYREPATERLVRYLRLVSAIAGAIVGLFFLVFFLSLFGGLAGPGAVPVSGNVAVIPLQGVILTQGADESLFGGEAVTSSQRVAQLIKAAEEDEDVRAIILEIDSPGGSPVASDEIAGAVKAAEKPMVAVIRELGASGAYWVASATDRIYAHPLSVTGSIGVTGSYLEFAGLLRDWNVTYRSLTSARYKDAGSPYKELQRDEEALIRDLIDKIHERFVDTVAENRNLPRERVAELANGFVYLGSEAQEFGLVDALGSRDDAVAWLEEQLNFTAEPYEVRVRPSPLDLFFGAMAKPFHAMGVGMGTAFVERARAESVPRARV